MEYLGRDLEAMESGEQKDLMNALHASEYNLGESEERILNVLKQAKILDVDEEDELLKIHSDILRIHDRIRTAAIEVANYRAQERERKESDQREQYENACHAQLFHAAKMGAYFGDFVKVEDSSFRHDVTRSVTLTFDKCNDIGRFKGEFDGCESFFQIFVPNALIENEANEEFADYGVNFHNWEGFANEVSNRKGENRFKTALDALTACHEYFDRFLHAEWVELGLIDLPE
jgi:hypothetical protein